MSRLDNPETASNQEDSGRCNGTVPLDDEITQEERASAARIQMILDKKLGQKTEDWIKEIASSA